MRLSPVLFGAPSGAIVELGKSLRTIGHEVHAENWQGMKALAPMLEILEPNFKAPLLHSISKLTEDIKPNVPWADEHFAERVSRVPSNPGESYKNWPFYPKGTDRDAIIRAGEKFTHTYQERIWCRGEEGRTNWGLRFRYGDLDDVINLLRNDPSTRQAFLPIWFPEDTGATHGGRVPCSLGYWFIQRSGYLHCSYYIRSCDYFRHFRDDIYLACRLSLWVLEELKGPTPNKFWSEAKMGYLNMYIGSLHCWLNEREILPK